jgi:hypothetical protein
VTRLGFEVQSQPKSMLFPHNIQSLVLYIVKTQAKREEIIGEEKDKQNRDKLPPI